MADERNALAELAEELDGCRRDDDRFWDAVAKSKRIVAELAKVSDGEWNDVCNGHPAYFCTAGDMKVQCCIGTCRAIAEEGAGDGK